MNQYQPWLTIINNTYHEHCCNELLLLVNGSIPIRIPAVVVLVPQLVFTVSWLRTSYAIISGGERRWEKLRSWCWMITVERSSCWRIINDKLGELAPLGGHNQVTDGFRAHGMAPKGWNQWSLGCQWITGIRGAASPFQLSPGVANVKCCGFAHLGLSLNARKNIFMFIYACSVFIIGMTTY